jgi:hypothetical protein
MMNCFYIVGIRVNHRHVNAARLQEALTRFGCQIRLRVGLHETNENFCSDDGVILLQVCGEQQTIDELMGALNAIEGVHAKLLDLN